MGSSFYTSPMCLFCPCRLASQCVRSRSICSAQTWPCSPQSTWTAARPPSLTPPIHREAALRRARKPTRTHHSPRTTQHPRTRFPFTRNRMEGRDQNKGKLLCVISVTSCLWVDLIRGFSRLKEKRAFCFVVSSSSFLPYWTFQLYLLFSGPVVQKSPCVRADETKEKLEKVILKKRPLWGFFLSLFCHKTKKWSTSA